MFVAPQGTAIVGVAYGTYDEATKKFTAVEPADDATVATLVVTLEIGTYQFQKQVTINYDHSRD